MKSNHLSSCSTYIEPKNDPVICVSVGGGNLYLFIVAQMRYAPKKQLSVYPSYKAVLKFSYEHPFIFTCTLVSLRIQFDWASGVFLENPVYKIG